MSGREKKRRRAVHANAGVLDYRNHLRDRDVAPSTINRRLSAIRSLVKLGRLTGMVGWTIEVDSVKAELTRDTQGPTIDTVRELLEYAGREPKPHKRVVLNVALLRLLFDLITSRHARDLNVRTSGAGFSFDRLVATSFHNTHSKM